MNILLIASNCSIKNGASRCLLDIATGLKQKGNNVVVILPDEQGEVNDLLTQKRIKFYIVKEHAWVWRKPIEESYGAIRWIKYFIRKYINNRKSIKEICKVIKVEEIEIVHINALTTYIAGIAAKKCNIPYVWHIREFMKTDLQAEFVNERFSFKLISGAKKIICISKAIKEYYSIYLPMNKLEVIYDGVDVGRFYKERDILRNNEQYKIIMLGRFVRSKGQSELVNAIAILKEKYNLKVKCTIVGEQSDELYVEELKQFIRLKQLEDEVKLIDFIALPERLLQESDIMCVCSAAEAFGLVTVEGMLSGNLVIGSDSGCTVELISDKNTGLLYRKGNAEHLASQIYEAIHNDDMSREISTRGQRQAKDNFSTSRNVRQLCSVYSEIVKSK